MKKNSALLFTAILGASGVALGALAAHALKNKIGENFTPSQFDAFDTAIKYQLLHALALLFVISFDNVSKSIWLNRSILFFITGICLFSGSIYFLATQQLTGILLPKFFGILTPIGGVLLITGWIFIGLHAIRIKKVPNSQENHEQ